MKVFFQTLFCLLFLTSSSPLIAQCCSPSDTESCCDGSSWTSNRPDGHAPFGIMGDHYHHKGGMMFSYRYMNMAMQGNLVGNENINNPSIFQNYMLVPQSMTMQMHMPGIMYAPSSKITLMLMTNYIQNEMDLVAMNGTFHHHEVEGFGDTRFSVVAGYWKAKKHSLHLNAGLNIPTGNIEKEESTDGEHSHHGNHQLTKLPYPMQLGSGTWDILVGTTYLGQNDQISWGTQLLGTFRTGENSQGYRWGNQYQLSSWMAYRLNDWMSFSIRGLGVSSEKMIGNDAELMSTMAPTTDAFNFGGNQITGLAGVNFLIPSSLLKGFRIGLEFGFPMYQDVNGIQMKRDYSFNVGLKYNIF